MNCLQPTRCDHPCFTISQVVLGTTALGFAVATIVSLSLSWPLIPTIAFGSASAASLTSLFTLSLIGYCSKQKDQPSEETETPPATTTIAAVEEKKESIQGPYAKYIYVSNSLLKTQVKKEGLTHSLPKLALILDLEEYFRNPNQFDWKLFQEAIESSIKQIHHRYGSGVVFTLQIVSSLDETKPRSQLQLGSGYWNHDIVIKLSTLVEENPYIVSTSFSSAFASDTVLGYMQNNLRMTNVSDQIWLNVLANLPDNWDGEQKMECLLNDFKATGEEGGAKYAYSCYTPGSSVVSTCGLSITPIAELTSPAQD